MYIGNQPTSQAFVTDYFNGDATTVAFTMSVAPANTSSMLVTVSGVLQSPNTYSINATTLTFSAAPPTGTGNISVRYLGIPASGVTTTAYRTVTEFTATASQTTFTPPSYTVGYISVFQNGSLLGSADYTATNGTTVVLAVGATVGDLVVVESFYVSSVLNAIPAVNGAVGSTYLADSSVIASKIAAGAVGSTQIASSAVTQTAIATGVAGTGPSFSAYQSSSQTLTSNTWTKIQFQTEEWDTASCFDSTTNYRFTPNVAGYYSVTGKIQPNSTYTAGGVAVYKNGALYKYGNYNLNATTYSPASMTCLVYLNGSTDYIELWGLFVSGQALVTTADMTYFQAAMVRSE
jgi:hypothetical protein